MFISFHHLYLHTCVKRAMCGYPLCASSCLLITLPLCFWFRTQKRMRSGSCISETCQRPLPLCWCCSLQPTTQMVHKQSQDNANYVCWLLAIFWKSFQHFFCPITVMMPAYSLNRAYSIFFVTFSVIGKQWLLLSVSRQLTDYCVAVKLKSKMFKREFFFRNLLSDELTDSYHL